jgi:hypothetical protein
MRQNDQNTWRTLAQISMVIMAGEPPDVTPYSADPVDSDSDDREWGEEKTPGSVEIDPLYTKDDFIRQDGAIDAFTALILEQYVSGQTGGKVGDVAGQMSLQGTAPKRRRLMTMSV